MAACRRRWSCARSGVEVTVLERGDFGDRRQHAQRRRCQRRHHARQGLLGQERVQSDPEEWKKVMARMLRDAADSLARSRR